MVQPGDARHLPLIENTRAIGKKVCFIVYDLVILFELERPFASLLIPNRLDELGIKYDRFFQSILVYRIDNAFINLGTIGIAFGPVWIRLEWKDIAVRRNIASNAGSLQPPSSFRRL